MSCCSDTKEKNKDNHENESSSCCRSESKEENDAKALQKMTATSCCSVEEQATASSCSTEIEESSSCCSNEDSLKSNTEETENVEYIIHGMDCPSCAQTIEKGLKQLKTIVSANVSYPTEKLKLVASKDYSATEVESVIKKLGFKIEPIEQTNNMYTYTVEGMDCGSCASSIEKHLMNISGIEQADVSFAAGTMKAKHTTTVDEVIKEVKKIGFDATLEDNEIQTTKKQKKNWELEKVIVSGILISTGFVGSYMGLATLFSTILFAIAIVISGYHPIKSAYYAVKSRSLDMNVLMSTAAIGAAIIGEWFEGATVVWLFSLGIYLQNKSMNQTRQSIRGLMNMAPTLAWVQDGNNLIEKPVENIKVGDTIVIKPGDKVPLDGKITQGETSINQAPITGESLPVDKATGDSVYAGTMNENGSLEVEVTKLVEDTTLAKIIHLVEEAQEKKAPTEAFIDRFANIYTPIVFIIALGVIILPPLFGFGDWAEWSYKGLALLVIACPCALVISTPVAIVSAIGSAARNGVLIKGGTFLEKMGVINAIAFDKTGTLTEGKPNVSDVQPIAGSEEQLLSIVHTLESHSTHPIAKTIVAYAEEKDNTPLEGKSFTNIVGKGVRAIIDGKTYYAGNRKLFEELNISFNDSTGQLKAIEQQGKTVVIVGSTERILGVIGVTDKLRNRTIETLEDVREVGMEQVVMLTGDNEGTAKLISEQTSINRYFAELLPEDKVTALKQLQEEGSQVAMVGDGINDAPALATADLGVAMGGSGTDTAMETADIVLMADNLEKLPYTVNLSRKALSIIKQNIWFSLIIKFIALILIFPGWLTLWMAVLSDTGAAIIVILNSLRLIKKKDKEKSTATYTKEYKMQDEAM